MSDAASLPESPGRVSVVVRCHNYGQFLGDALQSVWGQDHPPDETIVVDDGSSDNTPEVIEAAIDAGRDLRVITHAKARGAPAAFNAGVAATSGDLVVVLDADDRLSPSYLRLCRDEILAGVAVATTERHYFGDDNGMDPAVPVTRWRLATENCVHSASMFRRSAWDEVGGRPVDVLPRDYGEDWAMWLAVYEAGGTFGVARGAWLDVRRHSSGQMTSAVTHGVSMGTIWCLHRLHPSTVRYRHLAYRVGLGLWRATARRLRRPKATAR